MTALAEPKTNPSLICLCFRNFDYNVFQFSSKRLSKSQLPACQLPLGANFAGNTGGSVLTDNRPTVNNVTIGAGFGTGEILFLYG
jgi:hypothetical protein